MRAFVLPALLAAATPAAAADPATAPSRAQTYAAETPWFSVLGDDTRAVTRIAELSRRIGGELARAGFAPADLAPHRITAYVNAGDGPAAFNTADGRTSVRIPRSILPDERAVTEALARAALTRLAQASGRPPAPADHAVEALAREARVADSPGMTEFLARRARALGPLPLSALGAPAKPAGDEAHAVSAFWLHRAVRESRRDASRRFLEESATGRPPGAALAEAAPDVAAGGERAEAWWPAAFYRQIAARVPPVEPPEDSRERLRDASRFVVEENGKDLALDGAGLIARRRRAELIEAVRTRLVEIKTELPRTNPVWQNAFIARGVFLEKLPSAEDGELRRLDAAALAEAEAARVTSEEISRALGTN